jgi:LmbE family N-acetylglucosaminyl deacetylase
MKVLFVGPHPDDVEIGALGTLLKLKDNHEIHYLVFSMCTDIPRNTNINDEFTQIKELLNIKTENKDLPNRELYQYGNEIREILEKYRDMGIDLVFGPSINDTHQDHKSVAEEIIRVFKYQSILFYEIPHSCPFFKPTFFFPLDENTVSEKNKILSIYKSQREKQYIQESSITTTMKFRGLEFGVEYAEAFEVFRLRNLKW